MNVSLVGLDADDTLWHSESHFAVTEERFRELVSPWAEADEAAENLLQTERDNLAVFGYGVKGFTLSMVETAIAVSGGAIDSAAIQQIVAWGKEMMAHPVELLPGVAEAIDELGANVRLILITKGDLFHQESKIAESGLAPCFERIEILSEKSPDQYRQVLERCGTPPSEFMMVGNSLRSDVLPVIEIGGHGVHVPYQITWGHERVDRESLEVTWHQLDRLTDLPELIRTVNT